MSMSSTHSFPIETGVDLDFRPASYVADWCATAAAIQNVVGEERREQLHQRVAAGTLRCPVSARMLADHLHHRTRKAWVALDPARHISGEYLPRYERGENEIARIVVGTTPRLVYSLRAGTRMYPGKRPHFGQSTRRTGEDNKRYRLAGECGNAFEIPTPYSVGVLSLRELVALIDRVRAPHLDEVPTHLPFPERLVWWRAQREHHAGSLQRFVRVSSVVYPELGAFYRERLRWWVANRFAGSKGRMQYAEPLDMALEAWWRRGR